MSKVMRYKLPIHYGVIQFLSGNLNSFWNLTCRENKVEKDVNFGPLKASERTKMNSDIFLDMFL
jgi:hypothetical protein